MEASFKKDSLAYQLGVRPAVLLRDMSTRPLPQVVEALNKFTSSSLKLDDLVQGSSVITYSAKSSPEVDALTFYLMNHVVSMVRQVKHPYESLGEFENLLNEYHNFLSISSTRMFFYLLLICTRESRHDKSSYTDSVWKGITKDYGKKCVDFHKAIKGSSSDSAAKMLKDYPPDMSLGAYANCLSDIFHKGKYSSGFGGPAWGKVADVLKDFVHGRISAEMMMDTSFTLCHNNGPIFNKGMLFETYTHAIYKILDVQRSGQIPQMIYNAETSYANKAEVKKVFNFCHELLGEKLEGYVDWFLVEELGALHGYSSEKQIQQAKYGYPTKLKAKMEAEKIKKELQEAKLKEEEAKMVKIMPNLKVKKLEVVR